MSWQAAGRRTDRPRIQAGIAGGRRSLVGACRQTELLGQKRLEPVRPDLIAAYGWMKLVSSVHHAVEQPPILISQPVVDVEEPDLPVIGESGKALVDLVDDGDELKVVVS